MGRPYCQVDLFLFGYIEEPFGNILAGNTPEFVALATGKNRHRYLFRFCRRQNKNDVGRRFF